MITKEHLDELWERVEDLTKRLKQDPDNRSTAILLSATLDNYNAKLKIHHEDTTRTQQSRP